MKPVTAGKDIFKKSLSLKQTPGFKTKVLGATGRIAGMMMMMMIQKHVYSIYNEQIQDMC